MSFYKLLDTNNRMNSNNAEISSSGQDTKPIKQ